MWRGVFLWVCHASKHRAGPRRPKRDTCAHTIWEIVTKFCMVIKLDEKKICTGSTRPPALANFFARRMLTRDLLVVANILVKYKKLNWCWQTCAMLTNLRDVFIGQSRSPNIVPFHITACTVAAGQNNEEGPFSTPHNAVTP